MIIICFILYIIYINIGCIFNFCCNKFRRDENSNYDNSFSRSSNEGYQRPGFSNEGYQRPGMNIEMASMKLGFSDKIKYTNLSDN